VHKKERETKSTHTWKIKQYSIIQVTETPSA